MGTGKINTSGQRFALLAKMNESIFHTSDLANIWQIKDRNTLYTTLKRYHQKGLLYRVYKGLYSLKPIDKYDPYLLGIKAIHEYSYISTESILVSEGIILQTINYITLVSSKSKRFSIGEYNYYSRQLNDKYLFQTLGINEENGIKIATTERAVADLLYFNPKAYFDASDRINWSDIEIIQKKIGYDITESKRCNS